MRTLHAITLAAVLAFGTSARAAHWTSIGPWGGIVNDVVVDPQTPSTVYAAAPVGVFRSTDGGATWTRRNGGIINFGFKDGFSHLAIDAQQPSTLYLVRQSGTVEKTTDGGGSWSAVLSGLDNDRAVAVHPVAHQTVYVASKQSVSVSTDGGNTWQTTQVVTDIGTSLYGIALDPVDPMTAYVGASSPEAGVYKTTNRGLTWQRVTAGLSDDVYGVAVDASDPLLVYAHTYSGTFYSTNGGATWTASASPASCVYFDAMRVDPSTSGRAYAATCAGVYVTADGGVTWGPESAGITASHILGVGPGPAGVVYAGTEGHGVFRSTDAGTTWTMQNQGLGANSVTTFVTLPTSTAVIYAGTLNDGILKTTDGGTTWARADAGITYPGGVETVDFVAMDPQTTATLYATVAGRVWKTTDAGASWSAAGSGIPPGRYARTLAVDPATPTTLYAAMDGGGVGTSLVYKSTDGAGSWTATPLPATSTLTKMGVIAIDPVTPSNLYAGGGRAAVVARSTDGGASWTPVTVSATGFQTLSLAIDPTAPSTLYAGTNSDGFWRSQDSGVTWTQLPAPSGLVPALTLDAAAPSHLFASMESSVQATLDGGTTYADVSGDLPEQVALYILSRLMLDPEDSTRLLAGTIGSGIAVGQLLPCAADLDCVVERDLCQIPTCAPSNPGADAYGCVTTPRQCTPGECRLTMACEPRTGTCPDVVVPDGTSCFDQVLCTLDTCQAGVCRHDVALSANCFDPVSRGGSTLTVKDATPAKASIAWKWGKGEAFDIPYVGNPFEINHTGYVLCLADHGGPAGALRLVMEAHVPGGLTCGKRPCWAARNLDITYADRALSADGIRSMRFHTGIAGKGIVRVSGKGTNLPLLTAPPFAPGVVVELRRFDQPVCWQATFDQLIRRNQTGLFTAKSGTP